MKQRIKLLITDIKYYLKIITDFKNLNKYVRLSTIFCNRVEQILISDLTIEQKLDNIEISYSDFKVDYDKEDDITPGVEVENKFERN